MFGVHPVRSETLVWKLKDILTTHEVEWSRLWKLQMWVLYMGAMEAQSVNDTTWFAREITSVLHENGLQDWSKGLDYIKDILWVETIFGGKDGEEFSRN